VLFLLCGEKNENAHIDIALLLFSAMLCEITHLNFPVALHKYTYLLQSKRNNDSKTDRICKQKDKTLQRHLAIAMSTVSKI